MNRLVGRSVAAVMIVLLLLVTVTECDESPREESPPAYNAQGQGELKGTLIAVASETWSAEPGNGGHRRFVTVRWGSWFAPKFTYFAVDESTVTTVDGRRIAIIPGDSYSEIEDLSLDGTVGVEVEYVRRELEGPGGQDVEAVATHMRVSTH